MTEETAKKEYYPCATVEQVRWVLVCALRNLTKAEQQGSRINRVFKGIDNRRAVDLIRWVIRGRGRKEPVAPLTWQAARWLANATEFTSEKAYYNAERWRLHDACVGARLAALRGGKAP